MPQTTRRAAPVPSCVIGPTLIAALAAAVGADASTVGAQPPRASAPAAPIAVIALGPYPSTTRAFTIRARVRGHEGVFQWDTGEGVSMITPAFAARIGCAPWGQVTGYRMLGERLDAPRCDDLTFDVQGTHLAAPSVIVYDVMAFARPGAPPLDGALGLDLFAGRAVTFQLVRGTLTVESPASLAARVAPGAGAVAVPVRVVRDGEGLALSVDLGVTTPAGTAWMELDSGNSGPSMFVARYLAGYFGVDTTQAVSQPVRFAIGGRVPVATVARTLPHMAMDGNLGVTFLRQYDVTLDLAAGRAWLTPAVPPSRDASARE